MPEPERLEDGADPQTPAGDNLLLSFARTESAAYAALTDAAGGVREEDSDLGIHLQDTGSASPFGNTAMLHRPVGEGRTSDLVDRLRAFYSGRPGGPFIVFSPWPTDDLRPYGFELVGHPPLMVRPPAPLPTATTGLRVEAVTDLAGLEVFEHTFVEAYPVEELWPWQPGSLLGRSLLDSPWRLVVGYEDDRAVATAAAYQGEASIVELVSVRPEARGHGYGFDITAAATHPQGPTLLISSDPGRMIYERLGYLPVLRYTLWLSPR